VQGRRYDLEGMAFGRNKFQLTLILLCGIPVNVWASEVLSFSYTAFSTPRGLAGYSCIITR
jgi:hypothetical protein